MANAVKWTDPSNVSSGISAATINNAAGSLGSEYNNETNKNRFVSFSLAFQHGVAPTGTWLIYILYALDGATYEDGSSTVQPAGVPVVIGSRAVTTAQRVSSTNIPIGPFKFKPLVWNDTGQNSSASSVTLDMETHNEEIQS